MRGGGSAAAQVSPGTAWHGSALPSPHRRRRAPLLLPGPAGAAHSRRGAAPAPSRATVPSRPPPLPSGSAAPRLAQPRRGGLSGQRGGWGGSCPAVRAAGAGAGGSPLGTSSRARPAFLGCVGNGPPLLQGHLSFLSEAIRHLPGTLPPGPASLGLCRTKKTP